MINSEYTYIYPIKYNTNHHDLCQLELRQIFDAKETDKLLFSKINIDPTISPFVKSKFEIILSSTNYEDLLISIKKQDIHVDGFKVEYLILKGDETGYKDRLNKLRDVGYRIEGDPDYQKPTLIYSICCYESVWYFGILTKHSPDWHKHKKKPCSFSSSINMDIARTLISIATKGDKNKSLLDACCGVGTVMLEACFSGFNIEGCDINWKACRNTRKNLAHFNYTANVYRSDIKDLEKQYDAVIVDLPYNLYAYSTDDITSHIIESVAKLSSRIIIVSISDIEVLIKKAGLEITDFCLIDKLGNGKFKRHIWVCEHNKVVK